MMRYRHPILLRAVFSMLANSYVVRSTSQFRSSSGAPGFNSSWIVAARSAYHPNVYLRQSANKPRDEKIERNIEKNYGGWRERKKKNELFLPSVKRGAEFLQQNLSRRKSGTQYAVMYTRVQDFCLGSSAPRQNRQRAYDEVKHTHKPLRGKSQMPAPTHIAATARAPYITFAR